MMGVETKPLKQGIALLNRWSSTLLLCFVFQPTKAESIDLYNTETYVFLRIKWAISGYANFSSSWKSDRIMLQIMFVTHVWIFSSIFRFSEYN